MKGRCLFRPAIVAALILPLLAAPLTAQIAATEYEGSTALGLALRQLGTTKRVLMIAAHPDDERTQVLSSLALGQGADVAYLSLTRGEGGQNGIGPELQQALGLLRTEELLAARRLDGAEQFFTRAMDWGFSKNADEAFSMWPKDELLEDVVAVVRSFRPDVIISVFSGTSADGHGQHQAAGIIAEEAFHAAADPSRFPAHRSAGLEPHEAMHFFRLLRGSGQSVDAELPTGELDPLIGRSHYQVAMASRSRHRSQDMGALQRPGPRSESLTLAASRAGPVTGGGIFAGVDTTLAARAVAAAVPNEVLRRVRQYDELVGEARLNFNPLEPDLIVSDLVEAARSLDEAAAMLDRGQAGLHDFGVHLDEERDELNHALTKAMRIRVDAIASDEAVVPGQSFSLELQVWNGGAEVVELTGLTPVLPNGWRAVPADELPRNVSPNSLLTSSFTVTVPNDASPTQPYFFQLPTNGARYRWPEGVGPVGIPFEQDVVRARASFRVNQVPTSVEVPATFQAVDQWRGEYRRPIRVVPAVSTSIDPQLTVLPIARRAEPIRFSVRLSAQEPEGISGVLRFEAPAGWRIEPAEVPVDLPGEGSERVLEFALSAPGGVGQDRVAIRAVFLDALGRRFDEGYALVDYEHIRPRPVVRPAELEVQVLDVDVPSDLRVGYIAAAGDNVPLALAELGVPAEMLDEADLAVAPLEGFDVIVIGIRAYEGRPDLVTHNQRLLDYAEQGGTIIVQYNQYQYTAPGLAPYPIAMSRPHDRVTDPDAEVNVLVPNHPIFTTPNHITPADFEGWVQERGLYFLNSWDDRYTPLLEMADPGEAPNRGSLVVAEVGQGTYVYTGLALFRQLPAGVPGAYRLLANLLALGVDR